MISLFFFYYYFHYLLDAAKSEYIEEGKTWGLFLFIAVVMAVIAMGVFVCLSRRKEIILFYTFFYYYHFVYAVKSRGSLFLFPIVVFVVCV